MQHDPRLGTHDDFGDQRRSSEDQDAGDVSERLRVAFTLAHDPLVPRARPLLRKRIFSFVDEKKHAGWSADRVVAGVRRIARAAGLPLDPPTATSIMLGHRIVAEATEWALSRYSRRSFQR